MGPIREMQLAVMSITNEVDTEGVELCTAARLLLTYPLQL